MHLAASILDRYFSMCCTRKRSGCSRMRNNGSAVSEDFQFDRDEWVENLPMHEYLTLKAFAAAALWVSSCASYQLGLLSVDLDILLLVIFFFFSKSNFE